MVNNICQSKIHNYNSTKAGREEMEYIILSFLTHEFVCQWKADSDEWRMCILTPQVSIKITQKKSYN